ncbi:hypothetical protein [Pseudomonas sp. PD9R]|uniref:hypothetical protein n=1 Tax=Pseudomonas sp. PD9R TaxID=2853534 RepID=UPI002109182E|nr:hypothetical protein [Pseudomonas sp. PD9R]
MPGLNEFNLVAATAQGTENTIDAVSRIAKNSRHAPLAESLNQEITHGHCHIASRPSLIRPAFPTVLNRNIALRCKGLDNRAYVEVSILLFDGFSPGGDGKSDEIIKIRDFFLAGFCKKQSIF